MSQKDSVTELFRNAVDGNREALDKLFPLVYQELRRVAHRQLRLERSGHTLGTTALVHETYLKLVKLDRIRYGNRAHFFAIAARAMRRVLVSYAARRTAAKRSAPGTGLPSGDAVLLAYQRSEELLALDHALRRLEDRDARQGHVVECRFFGGMTVEETAQALGVSPATVPGRPRHGRAALRRRLAARSALLGRAGRSGNGGLPSRRHGSHASTPTSRRCVSASNRISRPRTARRLGALRSAAVRQYVRPPFVTSK